MGRSRRLIALLLGLSLAGFMVSGGASASMALFTNQRTVNASLGSATYFDTVAPTVVRRVISKTTQYWAGFIKQGGMYHVYAQVTDAGAVPSGVSTVTANVMTVTTGQTALALASSGGPFTVGGVSYNYRSAPLTANATLSEGSKSYSITAADVAGNIGTTSGFSVTVDNTRPSATDVQTTNVTGGTAGRPELGDKITLSFSEVIDPESVLAGWTGASTNVVLRISNASGDSVTVRNAANSAQLPLGSINLVGTGYVGANRDFGATGTTSTMVAVGNTIVITLGTASGAVTTQATGNNSIWTPSATATDRAANTCQAANATESGALDLEF